MSTTTTASSSTATGAGAMTGMNDKEAQEFHKIFVQSFAIFTGVAALAHLLVWIWRPWIPGPDGYASLSETLTNSPIMTMIS